MNIFKKLEYWLENGVIVDKVNGKWTAFRSDDYWEDLGVADNLEELIKNLPDPENNMEVPFKTININEKFTYLDQLWIKVSRSKCIRISDDFVFYLGEDALVGNRVD